jgi:hypothetical protein
VRSVKSHTLLAVRVADQPHAGPRLTLMLAPVKEVDYSIRAERCKCAATAADLPSAASQTFRGRGDWTVTGQ